MKLFESEKEKKDYQIRTNFLFVLTNLIEDIYIKLQSKLEKEYKRRLKYSVESMQVFNRMTERIYNENQIDRFDSDKNLLIHLIESEWKATQQGKEKEFKEYLDKFFENGN